VVVVVEPGGLCVLLIFIGYDISTSLTFDLKTCATCSAFRASSLFLVQTSIHHYLLNYGMLVAYLGVFLEAYIGVLRTL
jgi:hypothetical protein